MRINPVLYYVPNLIGYTRVILTIAAFTMCWDAPVTTGILYALSQIMDALDGTAGEWMHKWKLSLCFVSINCGTAAAATNLQCCDDLLAHCCSRSQLVTSNRRANSALFWTC